MSHDPHGFKKHARRSPAYRPVADRVQDHRDVVDYASFTPELAREQATRCMGCGVPFCQSGCPLGNYIPEFNAAVHQGDWRQAFRLLTQTNNFPEFTGRICPAPCEHACVLGIHQQPVTIEHLEQKIIETAFQEGWVQARRPQNRSGKKVAIVGSGPAGLTAADQLNRLGHQVTVFEKDEQPGGLLRFGIPDFKLEKWVVERRIALLEAEGVVFQCNVEAGVDIRGEDLLRDFDAVILCTGAMAPRDLALPGRALKGIHFAMDYLTAQNRRISQPTDQHENAPSAAGKHVVVVGGGDTGSDCVGNAVREGALSVTQIQYRPKPPQTRPADNPWPLMAATLTTSTSHEEGCQRSWEISTKSYVGDEKEQITGLEISDLCWGKNELTGKFEFEEKPGSTRVIPCELALIAIGFDRAEHPLLQQLGLSKSDLGAGDDARYQTTRERVFVAGDARRGQSLVVWAIAEGRGAASAVHEYFHA